MQVSDQAVRASLIFSGPFNWGAALIILLPQSWAGQLIGLPPAPALYAALLAFLVAVFGVAYLWAGWRSEPLSRVVLCMGGFGKIGVFLITALLAVAGAASVGMLAVTAVDLALGCFWVWWLVQGPAQTQNS